MIEVGSVLVRGGGRLSVLKPDAAYPGDVADEKNWLPAERLQGSAITSDEVDPEQSAIWILPPGTKTRAIRFTHTPLISDAQYGGRLGGALIMAERVINVAPLALPATSANHAAAAKINNDIVEGWLAWDNGKTGAEKTISAENSEWLMLVWPRAVSLSGLGGIVGWLQHGGGANLYRPGGQASA